MSNPSQILAKLTADAVDQSKTPEQRTEAAIGAAALAKGLEKPSGTVENPATMTQAEYDAAALGPGAQKVAQDIAARRLRVV